MKKLSQISYLLILLSSASLLFGAPSGNTASEKTSRALAGGPSDETVIKAIKEGGGPDWKVESEVSVVERGSPITLPDGTKAYRVLSTINFKSADGVLLRGPAELYFFQDDIGRWKYLLPDDLGIPYSDTCRVLLMKFDEGRKKGANDKERQSILAKSKELTEQEKTFVPIEGLFGLKLGDKLLDYNKLKTKKIDFPYGRRSDYGFDIYDVFRTTNRTHYMGRNPRVSASGENGSEALLSD